MIDSLFFLLSFILATIPRIVPTRDGEIRSPSFYISLTAIPPRFKSIHHTLISWLEQDLKPTKIVIMVPTTYKRFRKTKKDNSNYTDNFSTVSNGTDHPHISKIKQQSHATSLRQILLAQPYLTGYLENVTIEVHSIREDWGPLTKFVGVLDYNRKNHQKLWAKTSVGPITEQVQTGYTLEEQSSKQPNLANTESTGESELDSELRSNDAKLAASDVSDAGSCTSIDEGSEINLNDIDNQPAKGKHSAENTAIDKIRSNNPAENNHPAHIYLSAIDFWVIGDDDVSYANWTLSRYNTAISSLSLSTIEASDLRYFSSHLKRTLNSPCLHGCGGQYMGLTHFATETRVAYRLHDEDRYRTPAHIQGVDTYLVPQQVLERQHQCRQPLHYDLFTAAVTALFALCPSALYQDDYVAAFLFDLAGLHIRSIKPEGQAFGDKQWKPAGHVDGVSTSFFQMHRDPQVFEREEAVKSCITSSADQIYRMYLSYEWE